MKKLITILIMLSILCLMSCSTFEQLINETNDALEFSEEFCLALAYDDIENAKEYLHPDWISQNGNFEDYILKFEKENKVDFSNGVAIRNRYDGTSTAFTTEYNGSIYELKIDVVIGNQELTLYFLIVDNNAGYGIYGFQVHSYDR